MGPSSCEPNKGRTHPSKLAQLPFGVRCNPGATLFKVHCPEFTVRSSREGGCVGCEWRPNTMRFPPHKVRNISALRPPVRMAVDCLLQASLGKGFDRRCPGGNSASSTARRDRVARSDRSGRHRTVASRPYIPGGLSNATRAKPQTPKRNNTWLLAILVVQ